MRKGKQEKIKYQFGEGELVVFTEAVGGKSVFQPQTFVCQVLKPDYKMSRVQIMSLGSHCGEKIFIDNSALSKFIPPQPLPPLPPT